MKQFYLMISILLCITHLSYTMELEKKHQKTPTPIKTYNVRIETGIKTEKKGTIITDESFLNTQFLMKGIDWNDIQLIQRGIETQGNVNYIYPHTKLNLIQTACQEKKHETIKAMLAAPNLNINAHQKDTYPAIHLAIERGDKNIINLLFNSVGKGYDNFVHDAYIAAYSQYMKKPEPSCYDLFIHAEKMLHHFLRFEARHKQYALFTQILKEKYVEDREEIPKELQQYITTLYYALNIETVIANRYKHKPKYYDCSMKTKLKRRERLLKNPEPKRL
jgi:hypothetical protein